MRICLIIALWLWPSLAWCINSANLQAYFYNLELLEFDKARVNAALEKDNKLQVALMLLADMLYYEGQQQASYFEAIFQKKHDEAEQTLSFVIALNKGYYSLYYDKVKGSAYQNFYKAYQIAKESGNSSLLKASLLAILKYYNLEIAQNSDSYKPYLNHLESLRSDYFDGVWITIYQMIFYSKSLDTIESVYFKMANVLNDYEKEIDSNSPILSYIYYEKALKFELEKDLGNAEIYYIKTIEQARQYPFLRYHRFFAFIKLMMIQAHNKDFGKGRVYLKQARKEMDAADTLRSSYHLDLYQAHFLKAQEQNDSAFALLWKAYTEDFKLDFRRNTLEINRLNIELATQEKENLNLKLRADRTWLIVALVGVIALLVVIYFAYLNQKSKHKIQLQEREVAAMKLDKLLREQELLGIDAMIRGQEKERQRFANDLHDNLGSLLVTIKLHFQNILTHIHPNGFQHDHLLAKTNDLIEEAYQKVRTMAHARNAGVNAQQGLVPSVVNFANKVSIINKLTIDVKENGMNRQLENSLEITIYRVIQELITNVIKHAKATEAIINLTQFENSINLMVEDNGIGFDNETAFKPSDSMGLYSIQKTIEYLGGQVTIESIKDKGTTVIIDIPLP